MKIGEDRFSSARLKSIEDRIYNIQDYQMFKVVVDFNNPELTQNEIIEQTISVEDECPVSKALGFAGIGEGIVYTSYGHKDTIIFKSKGEKHSKTKVKVLKEVDIEEVNKIKALCEKVTPGWRLGQFLNEVCDLNNNGQITRDKNITIHQSRYC